MPDEYGCLVLKRFVPLFKNRWSPSEIEGMKTLMFILFSVAGFALPAVAQNCPAGTQAVVSQYPKDRPYTRVLNRNSSRQNFSLCWGVFAPVDTIACLHFMERPCVANEAAAVCAKYYSAEGKESQKAECLAVSANKEYTDEEIEDCENPTGWSYFTATHDCMEQRGRPTD